MFRLPRSPRSQAVLAVVGATLALLAAVHLLDRLFWTDRVEERGGDARMTANGDIYLLDLSSAEFGDRDVGIATRISTLEQLELEDSRITDGALESIRRVERLQQLDLSGTAITDAGLARLSGLQRLETLRLNRCSSVTGAGLAQLHDLPRLQRLDVERIDISYADLVQVKANHPGVHIRVDARTILGIADADESLRAAAFADRSDEPCGIYLDCNSTVTAERLESLKNPDAVVQLSMHGASTGALGALERFSRLRSVSVDYCDDRGVAGLAACRQLRSLDLRDGSVTDAGLHDLMRLEQLQYLDVTSSYIRGDSFVALENLHELQSLTLICPNAEPGRVRSGVAALAELSQLESLHLEVPIAGAGALEPLRDCSLLRNLALVNCGLTDESFEQLGVLPQVVSLNLTGNPLTAACVDTLTQWPAIQEVYFNEEVRSTLPPEAVGGRIHVY